MLPDQVYPRPPGPLPDTNQNGDGNMGNKPGKGRRANRRSTARIDFSTNETTRTPNPPSHSDHRSLGTPPDGTCYTTYDASDPWYPPVGLDGRLPDYRAPLSLIPDPNPDAWDSPAPVGYAVPPSYNMLDTSQERNHDWDPVANQAGPSLLPAQFLSHPPFSPHPGVPGRGYPSFSPRSLPCPVTIATEPEASRHFPPRHVEPAQPHPEHLVHCSCDQVEEFIDNVRSPLERIEPPQSPKRWGHFTKDSAEPIQGLDGESCEENPVYRPYPHTTNVSDDGHDWENSDDEHDWVNLGFAPRYNPSYRDSRLDAYQHHVPTDMNPSTATKRTPDVVVHLAKKPHSTDTKRVRGMRDSGNQLGPLIALKTALELGFRRWDFTGERRVFQSVAGSEDVTAGSILIRYYLDNKWWEAIFHVLKELGGGYEVNIPTEPPLTDPSQIPVVGATIATKRKPTEDEMKAVDAAISRAEAEQERAEMQRAKRKAAEREKKARMKDSYRSKR